MQLAQSALKERKVKKMNKFLDVRDTSSSCRFWVVVGWNSCASVISCYFGNVDGEGDPLLDTQVNHNWISLKT